MKVRCCFWLSLLLAAPLFEASAQHSFPQSPGRALPPVVVPSSAPVQGIEGWQQPQIQDEETLPPVPTPTPMPQPVEIPAELPVARAEPVNELEVTARLQIFLDQKHFGPGKIDGAPGEFTSKALARYQRANGLPVTGDLNDVHNLPLNDVYPIYTTYTITEADAKQVGDVPAKPQDQAKLKRMPYPTLLKFLQERYHSDPNFLRYLNPGKDLTRLAVGDTVRVPNVKPFRIEEVKPVAKTPVNPAFKGRRIIVDTNEKILDLYEGETLLASFPITPGSSKVPAPPGRWKIVGIATMPWFRYDEGVLKRGVRTDTFYNIPAGPSSPVGVVWIGLNRRSIGLHGTNNPQTIGRAASAGCVRLANWDAIRLAKMVSPGTPVTIDPHLLENGSSSTASTKVP